MFPYVIYGKLNSFNNTFSMPHPEMELLSEYKKKVQTAMQPVYSINRITREKKYK